MSTTSNRGAVLITGCSRGVGHATALAFVRAGHPTYATARNSKELDDLKAAGCHVMELDVTDEAARVRVVQHIEARHGAVEILINNAGYGQMGPLELITQEQLQRQFETNVFGVVRLCQLVIPGMRARHKGTIVVIGSMGGLLTTPYMTAYHMSKYAIESMVDGLRPEVSGFGIRVILFEPSGMKTDFGTASLSTVTTAQETGPYAPIMKHVEMMTAKAYANSNFVTPERMASLILKAAHAKRPKTRYRVGVQSHIMPGFFKLIGNRMTDRVWRQALTPKNQSK